MPIDPGLWFGAMREMNAATKRGMLSKDQCAKLVSECERSYREPPQKTVEGAESQQLTGPAQNG